VTQEAAEPSKALDRFRDEVRDWLAAHMAEGRSLTWSATWSTREDEAEYAFRRRLGADLGDRGWLFPTLPEQYGGGGLTPEHQAIIDAELDAYGLRLGMVYYTLARIVAPCVLRHGTDEQKDAFLPGMLRGEVVVWQLLTEPQSGSDVANVRTIAVRDGDHYRVTGQKVMVGSHHPVDYLWTLVCTDPAGKRHENLSWLYVPADLPGITMLPMTMMMGVKNAVYFDDVRVPAFNLIGGENRGWTVSSTQLELEHGGAGSIARDPVVNRLVSFCQQEQDGRRLIEDARVRAQLADALIEAHICGLLAKRNYWARLRRQPVAHGGAQFRYVERLMRLNNARRVQQIVGYESLVPRLDVHENDDFEHAVRAGPGMLHGGGTLDTDRLIMARRLGIGRSASETAPDTT
jgi:alkylation response protein AidB-like acyl-CoA dehydrogenase